ncbi:hypothetical protein J1N35_028940 [Gossypium stocksii]|uniref:Uncharacterized protein n=1 Tax=Gossypium stocksii TaxID=47602 RepID=A0A9D3ZSQ7_9ROSI|nr:hypothetical protein J1N35_028940 [Gossypium stocksii]
MCHNTLLSPPPLSRHQIAAAVAPLPSIDIDSEGKQSLPTLGSGNSGLGTEALAELVRNMVEEVLETKVKKIKETLQAGCLECKKRKDHSSERTEPRSVKHVKILPNFLTY